MTILHLPPAGLSPAQKLRLIPWGIVFLLGTIVGFGAIVLYSAAGGHFAPWAWRHLVRFTFGLCALLVVGMVDIRFWLRHAYHIYGATLLLLLSVELLGAIGMGARRWVDLFVCSIQPSELMKISLILALARYIHLQGEHGIRSGKFFLMATIFIAAPVLSVLRQPDLGTAIILMAVGALVLLAAGGHLGIFGAAGTLGLVSTPILWQLLHDYQKKRILTFLDPQRDPLGAGYHVWQSQIALGSGGWIGKGFLGGTQSHLNFLPEKQTDFIFTMLCEEFGIWGGSCLLGLYTLVLVWCYCSILKSRHLFSRILALGVTSIFFLHIFINIGMVMGLLPVVGVPLPLVSYGGTSMLTLLLGFGLLFSAELHQDSFLPRSSDMSRAHK